MDNRYLYGLAGAAVALVVLIFFFLSPSSVDQRHAPGLGNFDPALLEGETGDAEITDEFLPLLGSINPLTGEQYTEDQVKRIVYLARRFPENQLVPRPLSEEEAEARAERKAAIKDLSTLITAGQATESQIGDYYDYREKVIRDRLELIEFVLSEREWPADVRQRYTAMLENNRVWIDRLNERRQTSLSILEQRAAGGFDPPELETAPDAPDTDPEDKPENPDRQPDAPAS